MTDWEILVERYAEGRPICNCRQAYYSPCGEGIVNGERRSDLLVCKHGCSANQLDARDHVAKCVLDRL
jgi:hypothetical protein